MNFKETFQKKKIFVTGHTGFKGSWLIAWLHLLGAEVKGYALAPENSFDLYNTIKGDYLCTSELGDIRDASKLKASIVEFQPDFIFHLAAQPLVRLSYDIPLDTFSVNAIGTANVLDAIRFLEKPCIAVMITTDKVYHNNETRYYYKEEDRLGGYDPYSASKAAAEIVIDSYRKSFFNPDIYKKHKKSISVGRAGNVIGGGDWAKDRIIPDIIRALSNNNTIKVRNPLAVRPWQHVLEPISGYLTLAAKQFEDPIKYADVFNFGPYPTDNLIVGEIVKEAIDIWGSGTYFTPIIENAPHEAGLLQLDITKAINVLGWKPKYTAKIAIEKTISWYKSVIANESDCKTITFNQIELFSS